MKVVFLIRSLYSGGAERQLVVLSKGLCERGHEVVVAIFYSGGPLEKELWDTRVRVRPLNKRGRWDILSFLSRFADMLRDERPDILYGFNFDPNLVTLILKPFFSTTKVVWGIASSYVDFSQYDRLTRVSFELNRWLSRFADGIISNSEAGRRYHLALGYPGEKTVVIPNGIDTEYFRPDAAARSQIRSEWRIAEREKLIGLVGRLDPMKDHPTFLKAASALVKTRKNMRFVCVGGGPEAYRATLQTLAKSLGLEECLLWFDTREDIPAVYNALDIAVSSSYGEGLSNVIGEAMACGVPCVVTNVGDSAWVVGDTGAVVPPKDPVALKNAIEQVLDHNPLVPGQIRLAILERLSAKTLVANTERVLLTLSCGSATP